jgi:hypothetical protein
VDELPAIHLAVVAAIGRSDWGAIDPIDLACDLGLPVEAIHEIFSDLRDLTAFDRERLLGEPAPRAQGAFDAP